MEPALDRNWLITSLLGGSKLVNRNIFDIAFESDPQNGSMRCIWVASSDGLHHYDGYRWRRFAKENGLPSNFVRAVLVTRAGKLWVGTDRGAGVFDGKSFSRFGSDGGLAGQNVRRILEDTDGSLWFCSDSWPLASGAGGITRWQNGMWQSWTRKDGLPSDYVVNYFRSSDGRQFVMTSEGVAQFGSHGFTLPLAQLASPGMNWGSAAMAESPSSGPIIVTGKEVFIWKSGRWSSLPTVMRHEHGLAVTADGKIFGCGRRGENERVFVEWTGSGWRPVSATFPTTHDYVENLREGPDGSLYVVGFDCLRRWQRRGAEWSVYPGMPRPLTLDDTGSVWSMDDRGLYRTTTGGVWQPVSKPGKSLLSGPRGFWWWNDSQLMHWDGNGSPQASALSRDVHPSTLLSVTLDIEGDPWVQSRDVAGTLQVVHWRKSRAISVIPLGGAAWAIGAASPAGGMWYLVHRKDGRNALLRLSGDQEAFAVPPELISQYKNSIFADRSGSVWLMGDTGLHRWRRERPSTWEKIDAIQGASVAGALEQGGALWFMVDGTIGGKNGLALFRNGKWKTFDTDPIFSWCLSGGELLVGSKAKFYQLAGNGSSFPLAIRLPEPEPVIGIVRDRAGNYWLGTPEGTFQFRPAASAPETVVVSSDNEIIEGRKFRNRVRGASAFNPPAPSANFAYSWRIDKGAWTPFTAQVERTFESRGLGLGVHHLLVRTRDNSMNIDPTPADITFRVLPIPFQSRRWFWPALAAIGVLLSGLTLATAAARFKLSRQAARLEEMVEERTAELKTREEELRRSNRALQRTNDDLRQFSWAASHDLQEPLRMVVTYTQFLAKRYADRFDDTGRQFMNYAVEGAFRAQALLQALLEYWQVSEGGADVAPKAVDLNETLRKALTHLEILMLESGANVTAQPLPTLAVSEVAFLQLFQNLFSNAIKYARPGVPPQIEVSAKLAGDEWVFTIKDNGIGIAPEHRTMIFQLFKRLNGNRYAGAGIGLALCAKIVENLGGRIWVESEPGAGSTFQFAVPAAKSEDHAATQVVPAAEPVR